MLVILNYYDILNEGQLFFSLQLNKHFDSHGRQSLSDWILYVGLAWSELVKYNFKLWLSLRAGKIWRILWLPEYASRRITDQRESSWGINLNCCSLVLFHGRWRQEPLKLGLKTWNMKWSSLKRELKAEWCEMI